MSNDSQVAMLLKDFFKISHINSHFPKHVLVRAKYSLEEDLVRNINLSVEGSELHIKSNVLEPGHGSFSVFISIEDGGFNDVCTCHARFRCEHVAATLLTVHKNFSQKTSTEVEVLQLEPRTRQWLDALDKVPNENVMLTKETEEHLFYVLDVDATMSMVKIKTCLAKKLKKGGFGRAKAFKANSEKKRAMLNEVDFSIIARLRFIGDNFYYRAMDGEFLLGRDNGSPLLQEIINTGRCYFQDTTGEPLSLGDRKKLDLNWEMRKENNGSQYLQCFVDGQAVKLLLFEPFWYLDIIHHRVGLVDTPLSSAVVQALLKAPDVLPLEAPVVSQFLEKKQIALPAPKTFPKKIVNALTPQGILCMSTILGQHGNCYWQKTRIGIVELNIQYGDWIFHPSEKKDTLRCFEDGYITEIKRDIEREKELQTKFELIAALPKINDFLIEHRLTYGHYSPDSTEGYAIADEKHEEAGYQFINIKIPQLRQAGFSVVYEKEFLFLPTIDIDEWYTEIDENEGNDWFNLDLGIIVGTKKVNMLPILAEILSHPEEDMVDQGQEGLLVRLEDGQVAKLPIERVKKMLSIVKEFYREKDYDPEKGLRVSKRRLTLIIEMQQAFAAAQLRWFGGDRLRQIADKLIHFERIEPAIIPDTFQGTLRPYQQMGVNWLQFLREYDFSGILADEMGLGKTVQLLAHLLIEKKAGRLTKPALVIAPTSLVVNWRLETERFVPELSLVTLHGDERKKYFNELSHYDLILTTYPLIVRDKDDLFASEYSFVILDEAQYIKNRQAKVTQIVQQLRAKHRLCLTGTPMENHLGELWSQFHFLMPGLLGNATEFASRFRYPIERRQDLSVQRSLNARIKPFMLRRSKAAVMKELPQKTEIIQTVELSDKKRDLYETIRLAMHNRIKSAIDKNGIERCQIIILDALLKLRQVCCDPRLVKLSSAQKITESSKLDALMEMLEELHSEKKRILLFSQFTSMLELIEVRLNESHIQYVKLTGQTKDRATPIKTFQAGKIPVFLISLKAGGVGLNLTAADTVIHYDPWWNPAVEQQATDRAHRIGQDKAVFV